MHTRTLAGLAIALITATLVLSVLAPTAAARPPPAACADVGALYVSYQGMSCGDNEVCFTADKTQPGTCIALGLA